MAATALTPVEFHGASLFVITIDNVPFVAVKPICEAIGVDWQAQHARIVRHPVLNSVVSITKTTGADGKQYDMLMLPLDKLNGWLFGVQVNRVKPELRERLTQYQAECFDVLASHFGVKHPVAALPAPAPALPTVQHAIAMGSLIGQHVHQIVTQAVLEGGHDYKNQRWVLSFITDTKHAPVPMVDKVAANALFLSLDELAQAITEPGGMLLSNAELANLALACNKRLSLRIAQTKKIGAAA